jgi:transcriptional regulator with XRE-family HTH domain
MSVEKENELRRKIVGKFLRDKRVKAGLTQWDVAHHLEYSTAQFISNWERGVSLPPLDSLPKLSQLLRVSGREIIDVMHGFQEQMLKLHRKHLQDLFKNYKG